MIWRKWLNIVIGVAFLSFVVLVLYEAEIGNNSIEQFIERHEKFFMVLSTIFIAGFTFTLWQATTGLQNIAEKQLSDMKVSLDIAEKAANAARDSAEALHKIERAYVFLGSGTLANVGNVITTNDENGNQISFRQNVVEFTFNNHGKTPAILKEIFGTVRVCNDFGEASNAEGTIFAPGQIISAAETCSFLTEFKVDAAKYDQAKAGGQEKLLLFGSIHYFDVLNIERVTGFCWKYDFQRGEFRLSLDPDHNYWT